MPQSKKQIGSGIFSSTTKNKIVPTSKSYISPKTKTPTRATAIVVPRILSRNATAARTALNTRLLARSVEKK